MRIYNNGKIYGVSCSRMCNDEEVLTPNKSTIIFEEKCNTVMTREHVINIMVIFEELMERTDCEYRFKYYALCTDIHSDKTYMSWWDIDKEELKKQLNKLL
jgi:hypothetical protein